jgi:hypothetical protein
MVTGIESDPETFQQSLNEIGVGASCLDHDHTPGSACHQMKKHFPWATGNPFCSKTKDNPTEH